MKYKKNKLIIISLSFLILILGFLYSNKKDRFAIAQEGSQRKRSSPGEVVTCENEIPIGESLEEGEAFAFALKDNFDNISKKIEDTISAIDNFQILKSGKDREKLKDFIYNNINEIKGKTKTIEDLIKDKEVKVKRPLIIEGIVIMKNGNPVMKEYSVKGSNIFDKLQKSRQGFEENSLTIENYEPLRGATPCQVALNEYWLEQKDCEKSLRNFYICRL